METLGLQLSPTIALNFPRNRRPTKWKYLSGFAPLPIATAPSFSNISIRRNGVTRMQVVEEEYEVKQMRDMAAAKKRWEALSVMEKSPWGPKDQAIENLQEHIYAAFTRSSIVHMSIMVREGKVKVLTPKEAGYAIQLSDKTLLDVRPSIERQKAWVKGSTWIPIFDVDNSLDAGTLSRKITGFMMGGWWSGVPTLSLNKDFLSKVAEKYPRDKDLILACQKGLRSLAACELLYNAGYENLFWVQGGLEAAEEEDLEREGPQPFKLAGIGGLSEFLGWTDQQRVASAKEGWGYRLVFSARLLGLILAADALFIGAQQFGHYLENLRSQ